MNRLDKPIGIGCAGVEHPRSLPECFFARRRKLLYRASLSGTAQTVKFNTAKMQAGQGLNRQFKWFSSAAARPTETFEERPSKEAAKFKEAADKLPPGRFARDQLMRRVAQAETASSINKWLSSKICGKAC